MSIYKSLHAIRSLSEVTRYIIAIAASVVCFSVLGIILIYNKQAVLSSLTVFFPLVMLFLGCVWGGLKLPWFLSFLPPAVFFAVFCFTRLNGISSLTYLVGYVPICLAGSLVSVGIHRYVKEREEAKGISAEDVQG